MAHVYLLGAGFSKAIGNSMPVANDLLGPVKEALKVEHPRGVTFEGWMSYLLDEQPFLKNDELLINQILFSRAVRCVAEQVNKAELQTEEGPPPRWLELISLKWHLERATVVSFNYDLLIERCLARDGSPIPRSVESGTLEWKCGDFSLVKPHGSIHLDWPGLKRILNPVVRSSSTGTWNGASSLKERMTNGREPFLVPPTTNKSTYYGMDVIRDTWMTVRRAIEGADQLTLIGYSVAEADVNVGVLLSLAVRPTTEVTVVDKFPKDVVERLRGLGIESTTSHNDVERYVAETQWKLRRDRFRKVLREAGGSHPALVDHQEAGTRQVKTRLTRTNIWGGKEFVKGFDGRAMLSPVCVYDDKKTLELRTELSANRALLTWSSFNDYLDRIDDATLDGRPIADILSVGPPSDQNLILATSVGDLTELLSQAVVDVRRALISQSTIRDQP